MDFNGRSGEMAVFATVAQEGSLSAAARVLGLTPSAVSKIVARLEDRLGVRLVTASAALSFFILAVMLRSLRPRAFAVLET